VPSRAHHGTAGLGDVVLPPLSDTELHELPPIVDDAVGGGLLTLVTGMVGGVIILAAPASALAMALQRQEGLLDAVQRQRWVIVATFLHAGAANALGDPAAAAALARLVPVEHAPDDEVGASLAGWVAREAAQHPNPWVRWRVRQGRGLGDAAAVARLLDSTRPVPETVLDGVAPW
jgi:3',5'-cyclic AMP phosphodiesterase CpdA